MLLQKAQCITQSNQPKWWQKNLERLAQKRAFGWHAGYGVGKYKLNTVLFEYQIKELVYVIPEIRIDALGRD